MPDNHLPEAPPAAVTGPAPDMTIEIPIAALDEILTPWQECIGADFEGYRNHVSRMLNFCFAMRACSDEERRKLIIAGAFHDIGIWSDSTVDYLPPSIAHAKRYLTEHGLTGWIPEIELIIDLHHKMRPYRGGASPLIEIFRRADLADFSLGMIKGGVPGAIVRSAKAAYPNAGFHKRLMRLAGGWFRKHPLSPPPFVKW
jgi:hypothetical protein